jgi:hypothetical protein
MASLLFDGSWMGLACCGHLGSADGCLFVCLFARFVFVVVEML